MRRFYVAPTRAEESITEWVFKYYEFRMDSATYDHKIIPFLCSLFHRTAGEIAITLNAALTLSLRPVVFVLVAGTESSGEYFPSKRF